MFKSKHCFFMNSFIIVMDLIIHSNITLLKLVRLKYNIIHTILWYPISKCYHYLFAKVLFSSQDINNMYSNEPNCIVSKVFLNEHIPLVCQQQK